MVRSCRAFRQPCEIALVAGHQGKLPRDGDGGEGSPGWVTARIGFEDEEQARFVVLGYGPRVEVLAPAGLREAVAVDHHAAWSRQRPAT